MERSEDELVLGCFVFFFQAEDGIRDLTVTGVQTCALPIFAVPKRKPRTSRESVEVLAVSGVGQGIQNNDGIIGVLLQHMAHKVAPDETRARSEERRVGKECRSRWSPYH